jgi:hypothetical protein
MMVSVMDDAARMGAAGDRRDPDLAVKLGRIG